MANKPSLQDERELIYLLLHNKTAIDKFYDSGLSNDKFTEENRPILMAIIESYDTDAVLLTRKSFKAKIKQNPVPKERISQEISFNSCYASTATMNDFPMLIQKIIDYNVDVAATKALEEFVKRSKNLGNTEALKHLVNDCDDILKGSESADEKSYYEDIRSLSTGQLQYIQDVRSGKIIEEPPILTGIREIDYTMVTGLEKGTLTLFCADVASYKSTMLLNIGLNVWKNNHDVLFVPLEMHKDQMWRRACAREARIDSRIITNNVKNLTDEQVEKIIDMNKAWDENQAQFYMMQEHGSTTVVNIERQIERNIELIKPKVVVVDYIANLEAHKNRYGRNDLEIGDMLKYLRQMGKNLGFSVISAAQLGRPALDKIKSTGDRDKMSINSQDIRGSHEYAADSDGLYALVKSSSQPNSLLDIFCFKSRNGPTVFENGKARATLDVHPAYGLICSSPYNNMEINNPDQDVANAAYVADITELMDKTEKDGVVINKDFEEDDDMYSNDYDSHKSDDNVDIEDSVEEELDDWDNC